MKASPSAPDSKKLCELYFGKTPVEGIEYAYCLIKRFLIVSEFFIFNLLLISNVFFGKE
jgi:hypothetical protein